MATEPGIVPEISGPKFSIITKALSGGTDETGKRRFRATASSTIIDRDGDEITLAALEKAAQKFREGVTIFMDHDFQHVDSAYGLTDGAEIVQRGVDATGTAVWDLDITGVVNTPNPRAVQLADSIDGGYVKLGTSITARVRKHARSKGGGMRVDDMDIIEASIVGVPSNQRSWAHKAATAIKSYGADKEAIMGSDEDEVVSKGDLSAAARNNLDDSDFACPEQRKYPINDAAHVRAALSRIADPSNDQCGRDKIIAAARKFGIGDHAKSADLSTDDLLVKWAASEFPAEHITVGEDGLEVFVISKSIESAETVDAPTTEATDEAAHETGDQAVADEVTAESTEGVQESASETPETTPADEAEADTPPVEKAASYSPEDVAELVQKTAKLVEEIGRLREAIASRDDRIAELEAGNQTVSKEVDLAKETIEKVMGLPLRSRTAGFVEDFSKSHPIFAPSVTDYLSKRSTLNHE